MKIFIFTLLLIIPAFSHADSIYFGLHTDHAVPGEFNETNNVIMAQFDNGFTFGKMTNSYNRESVMFGYMHNTNKQLSFGVILATGYRPANFHLNDHLESTPVVPLPVLSFRIPLSDSFSLSTNIIGGIVINSGVVVSF